VNQVKKRVKLGRPRKLSPAELRRGVEAYFASISYLEPVEVEVPVILDKDPQTGALTYQLDRFGHKMTKREPVLDAAGKPMMRLVYTTPPGDFGLCDYLKISRDTWDRYGASAYEVRPEDPGYDPELAQQAADYAEIYALARGRVCAYLESAAEEKGGKGAQFKLERIYGLGEKKEIALTGTVEDFLASLDDGGAVY